MVLERDVKEDVFAPFNLEKQVVDNEDKLLANEKEYQGGGNDVFADFHLDSIVRENEEIARQNREVKKAKEEEAAAAAKKGNSNNRPRKVRFPRLVTVRQNTEPNETNKSSILSNIHERRRPPKFTNEKTRENPTGDDGNSMFENPNASNDKTKSSNTTNRKDNEAVPSKPNSIVNGVGVSAAATATTVTAITKRSDDSSSNDDSNDSTNALDGVGDMEDKLQQQHDDGVGDDVVFHWESVNPDVAEVDNVFSDFDLDAIVRDYERLARRIHDAPPDDIESIDSDMVDVKRYGFFRRCFDTFPRISALVFRVWVPLLFLVAVALGLGYVLGSLEEPEEYSRNDQAMRNRFIVQSFPFEQIVLYLSSLPAACLDTYIETKLNITLERNESLAPDIDVGQFVGTEPILPAIESLSTSSNISEIIEDLSSFMDDCGEFSNLVLQQVIDIYDELGDIPDIDFELTFDWIRCWDTSQYGTVNPVFGTEKLIQAARNQSDYYAENWRNSQSYLMEMYLEENNCTTADCRKEAFDISINEATGRLNCDVNTGSSAWLWFMVLTTVGYGNTAPQTQEGWIMVTCLGWISIVAFAGLLSVAGRVCGIIIDDIFRKLHLKWLTSDLGGVIVWGSLALGWMCLLAGYTFFWWKGRLDDPPSQADSFWFGYISLLTVGLGDYYIQSEFIFLADLFIFTFIFLAGFTFLSTFLDKASSLCSGYFPDSGSQLQDQLKNTQLIGAKSIQYKEKNEKALDELGGIVSKMDDDSVNSLERRAGRVRQKKEILIHLLYQTEQELDHFKKRGEKYDPPSLNRINQEENMILDILDRTSKEREKVERYRKRGKTVKADDNFDLLDTK